MAAGVEFFHAYKVYALDCGATNEPLPFGPVSWISARVGVPWLTLISAVGSR